VVKNVTGAFVIVLLGLLMLAGCTPRYVVTTEMKAPFAERSSCNVGAITDGLPSDFPPEKKPGDFEISRFQNLLQDEIAVSDLFNPVAKSADTGRYEVSGTILDYAKGNGFTRFLFGAWAGSAKVTVELRLTNASTREIVFAGNFMGTVTDWVDEGNQMFDQVSRDFVRALKKQLKNLGKKT
jgi:hypothetical protein